jgi:hypothetical protein
LLEVVSAAVVYLATYPDSRRVEQAVIGEALREEYGDRLPQEIADWLAGQPSLTARLRPHGARGAAAALPLAAAHGPRGRLSVPETSARQAAVLQDRPDLPVRRVIG